MKRAVILTGHFPVQKRRANIPWLADHMRANGWHVTFVTLGYSWVSKLTRDRRFQSLDAAPQPGFRQIDDTLTAIFGYAPIHPFSLQNPWLDRAIQPLHGAFVRYWAPKLEPHFATADLIVIESGPPLLLAPAARKAAPGTPIVYRASDDIRLLGLPPFLTKAELAYAPLFDRISVASPILAQRWTGHSGLHIDPIGVPIGQLSDDQPDPFPPPRAMIEAVCAGTTLFDIGQIIAVAQARPGWRLHVIGRLKSQPPANTPKNIIFHGERTYADTTAFIRNADVGLAIYRDGPGVEYQTAQSNRILLYRYFRLPILGPRRLCDPAIPSIVGYDPDDSGSIDAAIARIETMPQPDADPGILDWSDLYDRITSTTRLS